MTTTAPATRIEIRKAHAVDRAPVSAALAAAFHDDPVFAWIHPELDARAAKVRFFFDLAVEALAHHEDIWSAGLGTSGAALWVPYGRPPMSDEQTEAFGAALGERAGQDAGRLFELMALMEEQHPCEPHAYLWFLGVVPWAQGRGIGSALMAPVLDRVDRLGVPVYLEATSARSKALYERHGFVASAPFAAAGGPPVWPMWREPRSAD